MLQVTAQRVLSDEHLQQEWTTTLSRNSEDNTIINLTGQALMLKMLHSLFKEFATNTRTLETLKDGKSADVNVALRAKLKTHASEKHVSKISEL